MIMTNIVNVMPIISISLPFFGALNLTPFLLAMALFTLIQLSFYVVKQIILVRLRAVAGRTSFTFDDVIVDAIAAIHPISYGVISVTVALMVFTSPAWLQNSLYAVTWVILLWQVIRIATVIMGYVVERALAQKNDGDDSFAVDQNAVTAAALITLLMRIVLWSFGGLFILSNLGIEITSLIAGLGIGGIAVAFALQGILSDLFSSLSIYIDKPFRIGDFIVIGAESGVVEKIGIKTTRIRTLQGEELVMSNAELTTAHIHNFKKMRERRVVMQFGITYETPRALVAQVPELVRQAFSGISGARLERVFFTTFGDSALQFEVVYYIESRDMNDYLAVQQQFNLNLLEQFENHGVDFAYPTQLVYTKAG